jgi:hypothetical protein
MGIDSGNIGGKTGLLQELKKRRSSIASLGATAITAGKKIFAD